jgi:DNA polymerase-3 subunit alpha
MRYGKRLPEMSVEYAHLHLHTCYSLLDGLCRPDDVMEAAIAAGMRAVAITDHNVLYGLVEFYQKARKRGLNPLLGCEVYVSSGGHARNGNGPDRHHHLVLLAENDVGYQNLISLVTTAHLEASHGRPSIDKELLGRHQKGLIALSGCRNGEIGAHLLAGDHEAALAAAGEYADIMGGGNFYLELQDHGSEKERLVNTGILEIARKTGLPTVATNDVHYLRKEEAEAHDVLLCLQTQSLVSDPRRKRFTGHEYYFKSAEEMASLFRETPESIQATVEIAERCDVELAFGGIHFPSFRTPSGESSREYLHSLCREGLERRFGISNVNNPRDDRAVTIVARLRHELEVIEKTGFVNYYLVVWDFVRFAREKDIPVGLRGSGGASLVGYVTGITDIDPLRYSLVFERFLNPERVSPPDFDIDFCQDRRGEVIEYVREKYGRENVAQIITFGSLGARTVVRDVGRALEVSHTDCDNVARMIPDSPGTSIRTALSRSSELKRLYEADSLWRRIIDNGMMLEGLYRNPGTHAAGVIISESPLKNIVPLTLDRENQVITQYSMGPLADLGLLKMDLLGLRTLSVIREALELIQETGGVPFTSESIPEKDSATFDLLNRGDTVGVFQLESGGMRELLRRSGVSRMEDLIALIALYRPGPMRMLEDYIARKTGKVPVEIDHPLLEPVLAETFGVMVYQEQVQLAASVLAGFSLGQGDIMRRAMSKKDPTAMGRLQTMFIDGCRKKNRISRKTSGEIFDKIAMFAGYGFNKSHSAAYAMLSYRTAYLKANHALEFMVASLSSEDDNAEKMKVFLEEAGRMGLSILPPDVNKSATGFRPVNGSILFGLAGVRNVGRAVARAIVVERDARGRYAGLVDFCARLDNKIVNRRAIESLVRCGAFEPGPVDRGRLFNGVELAMHRAVARQADRRTGQGWLFEGEVEESADDESVLPHCKAWHESELLAAEKELLGIYISGHPLSRYVSLLRRYELDNMKSLEGEVDGSEARTACLVSRIHCTTTRQGARMVVAYCEGLDGNLETVFVPPVLDTCESLLTEGAILLLCGRLGKGESHSISRRLHVSGVWPIEQAPDLLAERVSVHLATASLDSRELNDVRTILRTSPGKVPVVICLEFPGGEKVFLDTSESFSVSPREELILRLERAIGAESVYVAVKERLPRMA